MCGIFYEESKGTGSPVIFLPGLGWPGRMGKNVADELMPDFHTYLLDLPGIGRSDSLRGTLFFADMGDWVARVLDELGLSSAHLIGHSMGAAMALATARKHPERVRSLVLLDGGFRSVPRFPNEAGPLRYIAPLLDWADRLGTPLRRKKHGFANPVKEKASPARSDEEIAKDIKLALDRGWYGLADDSYLRHAFEYSPNTSAAGLRLMLALYRTNVPKELFQVQVPTLLLYGTRPHGEEREQAEVERHIKLVRQCRPDISLQPVEWGHYVHWAPTPVTPFIREFLIKHEES